MYGCESWTIKRAESRRIDAFELWCWRRLLRVPWTARRSNQFILREISPWCSLEGLMFKLKLQYFGHLMQRADSFEKTLMLGKIESKRRRGRQRMRWYHRLNGHGFGWILGVGDGQGGLVCCGSWGHKELDTTERLNWTDGFCGGSAGKESACNAGNPGSIPGLRRSPGEGHSYPLQYSGLENFTDCIVHGVTKSWTWLSNFHFLWSPTVSSNFYYIIQS